MLQYKYRNLCSSFGGNNFLIFEIDKPEDFNQKLTDSIHMSFKRYPNYFTHTSENEQNSFISHKGLNLFTWDAPEFQNLRKLAVNCLKCFIEEYQQQYCNKRPNFATCWVNVFKTFA